MRSIDTNVAARLLLRDDPAQLAIVDALVAEGDLLVIYTVLVELEWVLRAVYKLPRPDVSRLLLSLTEIEGVHLLDASGVRWACKRHAAGADFADMIHLLANETSAFLTFDKPMLGEAGDNPPTPIVTLA